MSLVRALVPDGDAGQLVNVSPAQAEAKGWEVVDEPTHGDDGRALPPTRANGRPVKPKTNLPKTTVDKASTAKKADEPTAADNPPSKEN